MKFSFALALLCSNVFAAIPIQPGATLFENEQVKVVRALENPHIKAKFHSHSQNRVMVYLQSGRQRFEYQDGRPPEVFNWNAGQVVWSPADGMHSPEVISDEPFNIIEIELKTPGPKKAVASSPDPAKIDPARYKVEFENDQVRVLHVKIEPHGTTPIHQHALNRVGVYLTDQNFRTTDSTGLTTIAKHKAGDAAWATPITHKEENLSDEPFEIIAVEIK